MRSVSGAMAWALVALAAACADNDGGAPDALPEAIDSGIIPPDARRQPDAEPPAHCFDGIDNDGDGIIDFPPDPGCEQPDDTDETDPDPLPACANGIDDDRDGQIDLDDPGCTFPADIDEYGGGHPNCGPGVFLEDITFTGEDTGTITAGSNNITSPICGGNGTERGWWLAIEAGPATVTISTAHPETTVDTIVYLRDQCRNADTELGCDDDGAGMTGGPSVLTIPEVPAGGYFVILDTFSPGSLGDFKITVTVEGP